MRHEMPALTSKPEAPGEKDVQVMQDRASKVKMGRHSRRALDKLISHSERCGVSHIKDLVRLASRFADERARGYGRGRKVVVGEGDEAGAPARG